MKYTTVLFLFLFSFTLLAQNQVGINQDNVDPSAVFELNSDAKGLLIPRLTSNEKGDLTNMVQGLMIYETTSRAIWYFNGAGWIKLISNNVPQDGLGDTDSDTRVYMDFTNDNDQIRFFTDGDLVFRMNRKRWDVLNNGNSVFFGDSVALADDRVSNNSVYVGTSSGMSNVGGRRNVGVGYQTLKDNISSSDNIAIGNYSSRDGVGARRNVAIGGNTMLQNVTTDLHTVIGYRAFENHDFASGGVAIGIHSLINNTSGSYNVVIGGKTMESNTSSSVNTALGHESMRSVQTNGCVGLGYQSGALNLNTRAVFIDNSNTNTPLIFGDLNNNRVTINNNLHVTSNIFYVGDLTDVSDRRLKKKIKPIRSSLKQLTSLNAYRYQLKEQKTGSKEYGLIAQEVEKVYPSLVRPIQPGTDHIGVSYVQFIPLILQAEKEQFDQLQAVGQDLRIHETEISQLEQEIEAIQAELSATAAKRP